MEISPSEFWSKKVSYAMSEAVLEELTSISKATFSAEIMADSVNPNGDRLTTMELTYPRIVHSEFMTHREFSRNSASSRAIPMTKMLTSIRDNPFIPIHWGKNQKGMQAEQELSLEEKLDALNVWLSARDTAISMAIRMHNLGIHKQIGNRLTEPWMWITVIMSSTNFENFFALRCHKDAEPHIRFLAEKMRHVYEACTPKRLAWGEWHLPMIDTDDLIAARSIDPAERDRHLAKISAGRCARVSYLTHDGRRDHGEDIKLYERLACSSPVHASPIEHQAVAMDVTLPMYTGNFRRGWRQFRKMHKMEFVPPKLHGVS